MEMEILTTPGEIYPEIIDGGIDTPKGQDIKTGPVEIPPLRSLMKGTLNFNFNLGMDEIGYFVPTSQWDREEPYTYDYKEAPYGEVYVGTPVTAPKVHQLSIEHLNRLHTHLGLSKDSSKESTSKVEPLKVDFQQLDLPKVDMQQSATPQPETPQTDIPQPETPPHPTHTPKSK